MRVERILKIFVQFAIWIFAILFVAYLSVLLLFPKCVNLQSFKDNVENQFFKQTGLYLNIERLSVEPAIRRTIELDAHHVVIFYPNKEELLKSKDLTLKIKILPIIFRKIDVEKIIVNRPVLSLSIDKNGDCSLDKYLNVDFSQQKSTGFVFSENVPEIILNRYKAKIYDKSFNVPFVVEGEKLSVSKNLGQGFKIATKGYLSQGKKQFIDFSVNIENLMKKAPEKIFNTNIFRYLNQYGITAKVNSKIRIEDGMKQPKVFGEAKVSDLVFVVNGVPMKDNFINLKFLENKISVDADIKASPADRIKLSGFVQTGKDVLFDMKCFAENINLANLKTTAETLLNAMNIKNSLDLYLVSGRANLDFSVKGSKKHLSSSGIAEIIGASVRGKTLPCSITGVNSKINFANDTIKIEPTNLYVNGTPLELQGSVNSSAKADITIKGNNLDISKLSQFIHNEKLLNIKGFVDFSAKLKGNLSNVDTEISADLKDIVISEHGQILSDFKKGNLKITGDVKAPEILITLDKINILPVYFDNSLKSEKLIFNINKNEIEIPKTIVYLGGTGLNINGKITDYKAETPSYSFDFDGNVDSSSLYKILKKQKGTEKFLAATKGHIGVVGKLHGIGEKFTVKTDVFADKNNYISCFVIKELLGIPSLTKVDVSFDGKNIVINNLSLTKNYGKNDKILTVNGAVKNFAKPQLSNVRIIIPNSMTFALAGLTNSEITVKSDVTLNGTIEKPSAQGLLEIKNINIPEYKLYSKTNKIAFGVDNVKVSLPHLQIGKSVFDAETTVSTNFKKPYVLQNLKLKSPYLDLNEISEIFENVQTNPVYPGVELPITADGGVAEISKFKIGGLQAENITADFSIRNNVLKMNNIKGTAYGGSVSGKSEYNFLKTLSLSEISGKNAQMSYLFKTLTGKDDGTVGTVDYKLKLSSVGTKYIQQLRTSKGYMEFVATNGVMGKLGQFEHFLHAQNLISDSIFKTTVYKLSRAIKPKNTGVFTVTKGRTEILNGIAILKSLTVEGPNMSFYVTGKINLLNDVSDVKIYGRISQDVENALGSFASRSSQTILTTSSQTSIGNIFYDDYNTTLPKAMIDAIPPLNPNAGLSSRPFVVVIKGSPDNINSVKSFKWVVDSTTAPSPVLREVEVEKVVIPTQSEEPPQNDVSKPQSTQIQRQQQTPKSSDLPSFMDNLPDNIN